MTIPDSQGGDPSARQPSLLGKESGTASSKPRPQVVVVLRRILRGEQSSERGGLRANLGDRGRFPQCRPAQRSNGEETGDWRPIGAEETAILVRLHTEAQSVRREPAGPAHL